MTNANLRATVSARDAALRRLRWGRGALAVSAIALLGVLTNAAAKTFPGHARAATPSAARAPRATARRSFATSDARSAARPRPTGRRRMTQRAGRGSTGSVITPPSAAPSTPAASSAPTPDAAPVGSGGS